MSDPVSANIAVISLRKLLRDSAPNNVSMLTHLGLWDSTLFFDGAIHSLRSDFPVAHCALAGLSASGHVPNLDSVMQDLDERPMVPFGEWWNSTVIWDTQHRTFTRGDIVLVAADKDGGGHVDRLLPEAYSELVAENSLGRIGAVGGEPAPLDSPVPACVRHIAHEVLVSLAVAAPFAFRSKQHAHAYRVGLRKGRHLDSGPVITAFALHGERVDAGDQEPPT